MKKDELFSKLFEFSIPSYYNWKKENRPIIKLLEKYFSNEDLEEFLEKDKIHKFDLFDKYMEEKKKKINLYIEFISTINYDSIDQDEIESFLKILNNYNINESFFKNYLHEINNVKRLFEYMIEKNMVTLFEEIVNILISTDFKIIVEMTWDSINNEERNNAVRQYIKFNIFKYKKDLSYIEQDNIFMEIMEKFYQKFYNNNKFIFNEPIYIFKEVEKLKNKRD